MQRALLASRRKGRIALGYLALSLLGHRGAQQRGFRLGVLQVLHVAAGETLLVFAVYIAVDVHVAIAPGASLEKDHRLCPSRPPVLVAAVLISRISMLDAARADKVLFRLAGLAVSCNRG